MHDSRRNDRHFALVGINTALALPGQGEHRDMQGGCDCTHGLPLPRSFSGPAVRDDRRGRLSDAARRCLRAIVWNRGGEFGWVGGEAQGGRSLSACAGRHG